MPPRPPFQSRLLRCHRCQSPLRFRSFHNTAFRPADEPEQPKSRRGAAREAQLDEIDTFPKGVIRRYAPSSPQSDRRSTSVSTSRPSFRGTSRGAGNPSSSTRGGFQGRGRGRRRGSGDRPRGRGNRSGQQGPRKPGDEEDEKEWQEAMNEELINVSTYDKLIDEHGDAFAMPEEAYNYAQIVDLLNAYKTVQAGRKGLETYKASPAEFGNALNAQKIRDIEAMLEAKQREFDELIGPALRSIVKTDDKYLPYHMPEESSATGTPEKGQVGATPIGKGGMGNMVEDALRMLAGRPSMEWEDPKSLAQKLLDGEFMKFRNPLEKTSVTRLAEEMQWEPGQTYQTEHVGFREPDDDTKRELVETIVQGKYEDPKDEAVEGQFLNNIARIAQYNGTYTAAGKQTLLRTVAELMPQRRAVGQ